VCPPTPETGPRSSVEGCPACGCHSQPRPHRNCRRQSSSKSRQRCIHTSAANTRGDTIRVVSKTKRPHDTSDLAQGANNRERCRFRCAPSLVCRTALCCRRFAPSRTLSSADAHTRAPCPQVRGQTLLVQRPIADHLCSAGTKSTNQETLQPSEATPCMDCHCLPAPRQAFAARLCVTTLSRGRTTSRPAGPDVPGSASNTKPGQRGGGDTGS